MLDEYMELIRKPSKKETQIINYLVLKAHYFKDGWNINLRVTEMNDGMGSLLIIPQEQINKKCLFKRQISELKFKDIDNIDVIISLNIDQEGFLFELDIWKMNYEKIISFENLNKLLEY